MSNSAFRWVVSIASGACLLCVLGFYGTSGAAPQTGRQPFANSVTQRNEMIRELKEIKALLREQNALLRAAARQQDGNEKRPR